MSPKVRAPLWRSGLSLDGAAGFVPYGTSNVQAPNLLRYSRALVPRQGGATNHGQFGLVYQVAGADSPFDSYHNELAQPGAWGQSDPPAYERIAGTDYMGQDGYAQGFDDTCAPNYSAWGFFSPANVLAARSQDMSSCWNPECGRVHTRTYWHALLSNFHTSVTGSCA